MSTHFILLIYKKEFNSNNILTYQNDFNIETLAKSEIDNFKAYKYFYSKGYNSGYSNIIDLLANHYLSNDYLHGYKHGIEKGIYGIKKFDILYNKLYVKTNYQFYANYHKGFMSGFQIGKTLNDHYFKYIESLYNN